MFSIQIFRLSIIYFFNISELNYILPLPKVGLSLLHLTAYADFTEAFSYCESLGIPLSIKSAGSFLPIHYACARDALEILSYIVSREPQQVTDSYDVDHSLLFYAVESEDIRLMQLLFDYGFSLNEHKNSVDLQYVIKIVASKRPKFIPFLLPKAARIINPSIDNSLSLIMLAIISNCYETVKPLIDFGYSLDDVSFDGETAFDFACQKKQKDLAVLILKSMHKVKDNLKYANSIAYSLCELCSPSTVKFAFDNFMSGIDLMKLSNAKNDPPLFALLRSKNSKNQQKIIKIVELFLEKGYPIDFQPEGKNTFLAEACLSIYHERTKPLELIKFLLLKGANPFAIVAFKKVPLFDYLKKMAAIKSRQAEMMPMVEIFTPFAEKIVNQKQEKDE
ncbi:hypothetical protein TRFO_33305 [Tritrichomonas foetus]|uniref:Uncharacterized protein n=1 Tax=Tritrichomonas foetus TaxID=1144522 RepID=A0A1J4JLT9_9EUKA|nr:hypothetical protein TRFO_33305 [Tritrichomonas foetus]|eukprot:OHT00071.1 hypothetical protein TRFO_33305 [Tritrichomonas foetus]